MKLIVHRGAHEIGGNCVEVSQEESTIILDIGLPLTFNFDDNINDVLPQPLFNDIIQGKKVVNSILLSHPHLDHYGLIGSLPEKIPVYCGSQIRDVRKAYIQQDREKVLNIMNKIGSNLIYLMAAPNLQNGTPEPALRNYAGHITSCMTDFYLGESPKTRDKSFSCSVADEQRKVLSIKISIGSFYELLVFR